MNRTLIVARMAPSAETDVAKIFARSDATALPHQLGVRDRALFAFHGLYFHLIEFDEAPELAMRQAQQSAGFRHISDELQAHISAYDPQTWQSPKDAMARCFYHWCAPGDGVTQRAASLSAGALATP